VRDKQTEVFLLAGQNTWQVVGSLEDGQEDDENKIKKDSTAKRESEKEWCSLGRSKKYHGSFVELLGRWWRR
jgi:hypothetical protein